MQSIQSHFRITYIFHSCFAVEFSSCILVFDYWRDTAEMTLHHLCAETTKRVYFIASHFHEDHYNGDILTFPVPHGERRVILSRDIVRHRRASADVNATLLRPGQTYDDDMIHVRAFASTDVGCSFAVDVQNTPDGLKNGDVIKVFHAGDLNNWHWVEESTEQEIKKMEGDFLAVLRRIADDGYTDFDVVMFPIDPNIKGEIYRGARQFLERFKTKIFLPMHFHGQVEQTCTFAPVAEALGAKFIKVAAEGESYKFPSES